MNPIIRIGTVCLTVVELAAVVVLVSRMQAADPGFDRIIPGWTNYSTAFNTTHDLSADGEFATVASFYTPAVEVRPLEYRVVVVWFGTSGQRFDFGNFSYEVHVWNSLEAFIQDPRHGNVGAKEFERPSGGMGSPDTMTRGGRAAYLLRFDLAGASLTLSQCHSYLVGFVAKARSAQAGELYVPTAPNAGLSDVQAGNLVAFGWTYLLDAGGHTIYSGQLATALTVESGGVPPRLSAQQRDGELWLSWPEFGGCYVLESSDGNSSPIIWQTVDATPEVEDGLKLVRIGKVERMSWFRLRKQSESSDLSE